MIKNAGLNFSGNFNQDALGVSIPDPYIQDVNPDVDAYIRYLVNREQANFAMITITVNASTGDDSTASLGSGVYATLQKALSDLLDIHEILLRQELIR